jgi:DNA-binding response OmpR family regulator
MAENRRLTEPRALVIEDDPNLGQIFSEALKAAGFVAQWVDDGEIAKQMLATEQPHVIILDLHLPNISGEQLLGFIRQQRHLTFTRVILATADAALADRIRTEADLVLLKPISFTQLQSLAQRMLPNARS